MRQLPPVCLHLASLALAAELPYWNTTEPKAGKPAFGLPLVRNVTHIDIYYANEQFGTYNHGPIITYFNNTYFTSWCK
jgi:hypothetical protein